MDRVRGGDARAFEVIFDRHGGVAFSLAFRMCGRRMLAEDIVQEAFLSLWRRSEGYDRNRGSVRSWILSTVRNRAIDSFRHETVKVGRDVSDETGLERIPTAERTESEVEQRERVQQVKSALDELPGEQRRVIELAYFGGFTHSEIAEMLAVPAGTVKGRIRLGLKKLRVSLGDAQGVL